MHVCMHAYSMCMCVCVCMCVCAHVCVCVCVCMCVPIYDMIVSANNFKGHFAKFNANIMVHAGVVHCVAALHNYVLPDSSPGLPSLESSGFPVIGVILIWTNSTVQREVCLYLCSICKLAKVSLECIIKNYPILYTIYFFLSTLIFTLRGCTRSLSSIKQSRGHRSWPVAQNCI